MKDAQRKTSGSRDAAGKVVSLPDHAGYYLQKGMSYYQRNKLAKAHLYFKRAVELEPGNPYNHYNLACLLSKQGQLEEANQVFEKIVTAMEPPIPDCYFLLAINFGLLEDLEKSRDYLRRYLTADPGGEMADEARELLGALEGGDFFSPAPSYSERDLLLEKVLRRGTKEELDLLYANDNNFKTVLNDRLYRGPDEFKEEILRFYGRLGDGGSRKVLREFVKNPWIKERFRQLALLELRALGEDGKIEIFTGGALQDVEMDDYPVREPVWRAEWQRVVSHARDNMRRSKCYDESFFEDVQAIWHDFINTTYPDVPRITKPEAWAAALEYSLARFHCLSLTQKELAVEYGVSQASISGKYREINEALGLDRKAYQNMLDYIRRYT
jgi:tetratricopeptide (TPR) repeat protein